MQDAPTPRQIAKGLLSGNVPSRPLFLPIVFSLGARVENLPLRTFLGNPTKITNSLRQIRSHLRADGVACYFDPLLEIEALGATLQWKTENGPVMPQWPQHAVKGELPKGLPSPEEVAKGGRVRVAAEVVRRMNAIPQREFLLMTGISGPLTLATRLTQLEQEEKLLAEDLPEAALELAASVITQVASVFVEAGADIIIIQEDVLPVLGAAGRDSWASLLAPAINVIRFYEALPVLMLANGPSFLENCHVIFERQWDCVICAPLQELVSCRSEGRLGSNSAMLGISLTLEAFREVDPGSEDLYKMLRPAISEMRPVILTTAGDVPVATDVKRLAKVFEEVPRAV